MRQFMLGLVLGSVFTAGLGLAQSTIWQNENDFMLNQLLKEEMQKRRDRELNPTPILPFGHSRRPC